MSQEANASDFPSNTDLDSFSFLGREGGAWSNRSGALIESILRRTSHHTANATLTAEQSGTTFTNLGASGTITFTLPAATVGLHFPFFVRATQRLQVDPNGSEILESTAAVAGSAGQYIWADAIGEMIHLVCLETGKWAVLDFRGTWTVA